ncbi:hypothetical protein FRACYDRAFT_244127 [Fragilariopsis cylindrus CCMP1102]|uniref:Uncharacterized protein n=1 Tax=Fragilariopsis cylindrus CCMP1102 TaxID=635003 RepID=A0A1E7F4C5_9STRA|nr:hypothetical protein FRACYDRAFT_244127 [Fragilariopsis cylindrus CCMP1102]|eukprot:OEU12855.1 hypothetical protein FRACYDRAFT_244127 [Fragilariopsis cylindrus CCMP1102]
MKMNTLDMKFKKRTEKSVRFNSITYTAINTDTGTDTSPFITNNELEYNSWYDKSELMQFRQSAVDIALFQYNRSNIGDDDTNKLPRGMEGMSKHRRQHKKITLKCILLAIRCGKPPHYVASLSKKLGSWNTEIAIRDACLDYFEIYQPQQFIHNTLRSISSKPPFISLVPRTTANSTSTNTDSAAAAAAAAGSTCAATRRQRSSSSSTTINTAATSTTASTKKRGRCIGNGPSSLLTKPHKGQFKRQCCTHPVLHSYWDAIEDQSIDPYEDKNDSMIGNGGVSQCGDTRLVIVIANVITRIKNIVRLGGDDGSSGSSNLGVRHF